MVTVRALVVVMVPDWRSKQPIVTLVFEFGTRTAETIVALIAEVLGMVAGVQLPATFQEVELLPSQTLVLAPQEAKALLEPAPERRSANSKAARNFHVPISEETHRRLRAASQRTKRPATALAREAIEAWLEEQRKRALHQAIAEYAGREAGGTADLDPELEGAATEHLRRSRR